MRRTIFEPEHEQFRATARRFFETYCVPHVAEREKRGHVDREVWRIAGKLGLLGWEMPEEFGGSAIVDFRFNSVLNEEYYATGSVGVGFGVQNDILSGYFRDLTTDEQKRRRLPGFVSGDIVTAIAMSEPGAGSDLAHIRTSARRDGDDYVIDGTKTFISNGLLADLVVVVCRTDPDAAAPHEGISLIAVESDTQGFTRGRQLNKIGQHAADTMELHFEDVRVPASNLIGEQNRGFYHLMRNLPSERLGIAVHATAQARRALELTTLAVVGGELSADEAAGAKWWSTETQWRIVDRCLQLHGGYGYINEYGIARLWRDARVQRIYGGTSEIMLDIVGRQMGF